MLLDELIRTRRDAIVRAFLERARGANPSAGPATEAGLVDHVPRLLDELADAIETGRTSLPPARVVAAKHAQTRWEQGMDIRSLVREYGVLRSCVLDVIGEPHPGELATLTAYFESSVANAVAEFAAMSGMQLQHENQRLARAHGRLATLTQLAFGLSEARTPSQVADVVVEQGMRGAHADTCTLYMLDETGSELVLIGERGVAPGVVDRIRRMTETSGNPGTLSQMRSGTAIWAETEADYLAIFPALATMKAEGRRAKAFWSVPLIVEGHPLGLLGMGFYEPQRFSPDERAFVETFTKQCAQALLRALHQEREDETRRWFTTVLRSVGDAVIAADTHGRITFMNPVAERLTGWVASDARGRQLDEVFAIFSEETGATVESPVTKVLREGTVVGLANHTFLRSKQGVQIPVEDSGAPIQDETGRLFGVVLVFRDGTREKRDRVQREFLVRAGEALVSSIDYRAILETVAEFTIPELADWCSIHLMDPGATAPQQVAVAHADPKKKRFAREFGERYPPDPNARRGAPEVIRTGKSELYAEIPERLLEAGARDADHLRSIRELRLESAMVVPLRGRGRILGAMTFVYADSGRRYGADDLAFAEDFARRAAMAIENAQAMKDAEDARSRERLMRGEAEIASRAKDEFLATVSHELRTPLNAILGWTVMLRGREPAPEMDRGLAIIERNARAQAKLVEDVLDVSRIISGKLSLNLSPTNIADAIAASIETVAPAAASKSVTITAQVEDASLEIPADADRVQQIVWNLLSNAVKFTPKGGAVSVQARREGSDVHVSVKDSGEGIRPETLPHVFEPFRQADASTTRLHGGLGLGLAIVKQLVVAHGGTVHAMSEGEGKGATFVVQLPAKTAVPAVSQPQRPASQASAASDPDESVVPRLDGLRILIVDDEADARAIVGEVLGERGAEVCVASSALEALEQFARIRPDLIVSDIGMPQVDGYSLIRKIRALPRDLGGRTPAVALTAYARKEDVERALAAGYETHVAKPVEPARLVTVVAELCGRAADGLA